MRLSSFVRGLVLGGSAAIGMSAYNWLSQVQGQRPLTNLSGEIRAYSWRRGRICYQVAGAESASPLLLVHGIYATASRWEMRKLHEYFQATYRVYTPDLLGFGLSDHPAIRYDDELYIQLVADFVRDVVGRGTAVIASSLSGSFVIAAAAAQPDRFGPLVLIEPVGLRHLAREPGAFADLVSALFRSQVLGEFLFNLLVSTPSIRWFLRRQGYLDPLFITDEVVRVQYDLSHQPNARFAPAAFVAGALNRNVRSEFGALRQPILLTWGYQSTITPIQHATAFLQANPRAEIIGFDARSLPHDEAASAFNEEVGAWLRALWPAVS
ncbi:MAG: alpha/beta fold hydrolase [Ardenticatenaceae bacterium]|nr:alpha/beta fold hydrolase [Ardenticatenaceae bacterium]